MVFRKTVWVLAAAVLLGGITGLRGQGLNAHVGGQGAPTGPTGGDAGAGGPTVVKPGPVAAFPWLHAGLRLTFRTSDSTFQADITDFHEQENGTWTPSDRVQPSGGGEALTQVTILDATATKVAIENDGFLLDAMHKGNGAPIFQGSSQGVLDANVGNLGDRWMRPAQLVSFLKAPPPPPVSVGETKWKIGTHVYDAAVIRNQDPNASSINVYDLASGMLLHSASRVIGAASFDGKSKQLNGGSVVLHSVDFVGARDVSLPWENEPQPGWVANLHALHFAGKYVIHNTVGLREFPQAIRADMKLAKRMGPWVQMEETLAMQGSNPMTTEHLWCSNEVGGGWIAPASLAKLKQGQVVDFDPYTTMKTVVSHVDGQSVIITLTNGQTENSSCYSKADGMLIGVHESQVALKTEAVAQLVGKE